MENQMSYKGNRHAERQDKVRRNQSYQSLAHNRKGKRPPELTAEQEAYKARFKTRPETVNEPEERFDPVIITDEGGNYADTVWIKPDRR